MAGISEINKPGGSIEACSWEHFMNKKNILLIRLQSTNTYSLSDEMKKTVDKNEDTIKAAKDENEKLLQKYKMAIKKCNDFETENTMLKSMHVSSGGAGRAYAPPDFGPVLTAPPQIFYPNPYCLPPQIFRP